MFWSSGGKDDDDQVGAFAVATDDQRQEFDADMKVRVLSGDCRGLLLNSGVDLAGFRV